MTQTAAYLVVDDFLPAPLAASMRGAIDAHFAAPGAHRAETHQVWNYWFVPELYTYLRTTPENIIARDDVEQFHQKLTSWSATSLGMAQATWPYLSLYVPGCRQGLHNDATNGRFGFVYSLTKDARDTTGGETILFREGDHFRSKLTQPSAGRGFYDSVAPKFNRLVVFDDRVPHAVERVEGAMDPLEGRFVLHGHLSEAGIIVSGALGAQEAGVPLADTIRACMTQAAARLRRHHGPLAIKLTVTPAGKVESCLVLLDRVVHPDSGNAEWDPWCGLLLRSIAAIIFPTAGAATEIIQPIIFGKPI